MNKRPSLGFWQISNMSFVFLAIQFGLALQNANVSRIFETLGANVGTIPILWMAVGLFWIMAAAIIFSMNPFRTFVGNKLPEEQGTRGFHSFFIGTGAVLASALPYILTNWFGISNVAETGEKIPESVKLSFYIGGAVFLISVLWNVFLTQKYSFQNISEFNTEERKSIHEAEPDRASAKSLLPSFIGYGFILLIIGILGSFLIRQLGWGNELLILPVCFGAFGITLLVSAWYTRQGLVNNGFVGIMADLMGMTKVMKQLAIVQFLSWFAIFSMWIFTTSAVTSHIYGTSDPSSKIYNDGADWVGILFAVYNGFAVVAAFCLPFLVKWTSRKVAHAFALVCAGLGLASFYVVKDTHLLVVSMLGVGIAWASILTLPYAILTGSLSAQKVGTSLKIFNLFILFPMILAAGILGFFIRVFFNGHTIFALILGGALLLAAAVSVMFVDDVDQK